MAAKTCSTPSSNVPSGGSCDMAKAAKPIPVQSVRIYLLKKTVNKFEDALRDDVPVMAHALTPLHGMAGKAYIRKAINKEPRWMKFLQGGLAKKLPPMVSAVHAAVVFLEVDKRIVAIVFGMGRYLLKDTSYEADFGIISALNSVDPKGLRSTDTFQFEAVAVQKRTQTSRTTSLSDFEIDTTREQVRSVTGKAKSTLLAKRVTGTDGAFGANVRVTFKDLVEMCREVMTAFQAKDYRKAFPRFDNLRRVSDKHKLLNLEAKLIQNLTTGNTDGVYLSAPEPIEYDDFTGFSFTEKGDIYDELTLSDYLGSRKDLSTLDLNAIKRHRVFLRKETTEESLARWSVFKCLICEFPDGKDIFVLMNGEWYQIAKTFAQQVRDSVATIKELHVGLPSLGSCTTETEYLASIGSTSGGLIVLDQKRAYCEDAGTYIEICDVITKDRDLIHIKRKDGGSSDLSHLFNQGRNSALALLRDAQYRVDARKHLSAFGRGAVRRIPKEKPSAGAFRVVYGIMGHSKLEVAKSLPFFSQISLMYAAQDLAERGIEVGLCRIS
jgi:uncharacterized protein (TIGR04141 family)